MPVSTNADDLYQQITRLNTELTRLEGILAGWQRSGQSYPHFDFVQADRAKFIYPPLRTAQYELTTVVSMTSGWSDILYDKISWDNGVLVYSTVSPGTFSYRYPPTGLVLFLSGKVWYANEETIYNSIQIFDKTASTGTIIEQVSAGNAILPISHFYRVPEGSTGFSVQAFLSVANEMYSADLFIWEIDRRTS